MLILFYKKEEVDNRFGRNKTYTKYVMRKGCFVVERLFTPEMMQCRKLVAQELRESRKELSLAVRGAHGDC